MMIGIIQLLMCFMGVINYVFNENQNNLVVGIKGLKGSGKTLLLTILLLMEYMKGKKVFTNYKVFFPHEIIDVKKMVELDEDLENCVIGISEMHLICDARRHGKEQNILMSYFVLQSRHRGVNLYYDTQFERQIDIRIVENTDINIVCENLHIDTDNDGLADLFRIIIQDKRMMPVKVKQKVFYGKPFWQMYDTNDIVDIFTMKKLDKLKKRKR